MASRGGKGPDVKARILVFAVLASAWNQGRARVLLFLESRTAACPTMLRMNSPKYMSRWSPSTFRTQAGNLSEDSIRNAVIAAHRSQDRGLPAILTLNHLARLVEVEYRYLRQLVERQRNPYRSFQHRKHRGGFRTIVVPEHGLMRTQKWLSTFILNRLTPHPASFAYQRGRSIVDCAKMHLRARWLIKIDVRQFFESITEIQAWRIFNENGYGRLISFEIARLVTRELPDQSLRTRQSQWIASTPDRYSIRWYRRGRLGYLPQGAPTSPMLSNLAMHTFDDEAESIATDYGLSYTRYSDDLIFSTSTDFSREKAVELVRRLYRLMNAHGLRPHQSKTVISPPGARKVVLGLLVDGDAVRLRREYRRMLECHSYFLAQRGPIEHAKIRGFDSVLGFRRYFEGMMNYANAIEPEFVRELQKTVLTIDWPA